MLLSIRHGAAVLVDQNTFQRKMLRTLLRASGFSRVTELESVEDGLDEAGRSQPDFMFVDYDTAQGSDLLRGNQNIRKAHLSEGTYLIVLMQNPTRHRVDSAIACGAHWVISRPFSPKSLNRRMRAVLEPDHFTPLVKPIESVPNNPAPVEERSDDDLSVVELARQMDDLLKQSRFFKEGSSNKDIGTRAELAGRFVKLEQRYKEKMGAPAKPVEPEEDVFLI